MHIHNATSKIYRLIGYGRFVTRPMKEVVIYEQLHESKLRETGES